MSHSALIEQYRTGPSQLRAAVAGMTREQLAARPVPGKWSTLEVLCHLADFEPIYADRMKRVLAEKNPQLPSGDPDLFQAGLAYSRRDAEVIVNAVFDSMTEALRQGERIEIRGFGSFVVKSRRAREGRNPKTGEIVAVAAKRVPFFKVGKELKLRVDGKVPGPETAATTPGD